ncbi:MAG: hypothetical protein M3Q49_07180 [Actinomycetota bacterium]|nr:hypothetical protein [Actinomycetota bacterium]
MHGFTAGIAKRLRALELRLGTIPTTETDAETARRLTLCRAALAGEIPEDLTAAETVTFEKITASVSVFQELLDEGIIDAYGQPAGVDHPDLRHDDDLDAPVWRP